MKIIHKLSGFLIASRKHVSFSDSKDIQYLGTDIDEYVSRCTHLIDLCELNVKSHNKSISQWATKEIGQSLVYFLLNYKTNLIKIGYTKNLKSRIKSINKKQGGATNEPIIKLLHTISCHRGMDVLIETKLHKTFKEFRKDGEWFDISLNEKFIQLDTAKVKAEIYQEHVNALMCQIYKPKTKKNRSYEEKLYFIMCSIIHAKEYMSFFRRYNIIGYI